MLMKKRSRFHQVMKSTHWPSVDKAMRGLRAELPQHEEMLDIMRRQGEKGLKAAGMWENFQKHAFFVAVLRSEYWLRKFLENVADADGSVDINRLDLYSGPTWKLMTEGGYFDPMTMTFSMPAGIKGYGDRSTN